MARAPLLTILRALVTAVVLASAAACGGATDVTTDAGAAAQPAEEAPPPAEDDGDPATRPGGPDDTGEEVARPGGPFDIEAFENIGGPLDSFRDSAASTCGDGACTVTEVISEADDAPEGCSVDSIEYDPPAQPEGAEPTDQFIQRGTSVTAFVSCPPEDTGGEETG